MPPQPMSFWKRFFVSRWFLVVGIVLLVLLGFAYSRAFYQNYRIRQEIKRLDEESERLQAKKFELRDMLNYVQSPGFVERKARTELNLMKSGEKMVIINGAKTNAVTSRQTEPTVVKSPELTNLEKWWRYFFGSADQP